jgi:hypothetical protein
MKKAETEHGVVMSPTTKFIQSKAADQPQLRYCKATFDQCG